MKKAFLAGLVILLVAVMATPVMAFTLSLGEKEAKYSDHSNLYYDHDDDPATPMLPRPVDGLTPTVGDENRTIFRTTTIEDIATEVYEFTPANPTELTGVLYDLELLSVSFAGTVMTLDFGPAGRNALPDPGATAATAGFGGVLEIYEDGTKDYTADPGSVGRLDALLPTAGPIAIPAGAGPTYWVEGAGGASRDTFVNVTDGTLWLSGIFVDFVTAGIGGHTAGTVWSETLDLTTGVGSASGYVHLVGGSYAWAIDSGFYGPYMDLTLGAVLYTPKVTFPDGVLTLNDVANYDGLGYWQIDSEDPTSFMVIPEPATLSLFGLAILGIGAFRRRKSR